MKVAFATWSGKPGGSEDDHTAGRLLDADFVAWDDEAVDWHAYDRVVLRSVRDYYRRLDAFLDWCQAVGPDRLRNSPDLVAFNADKRYLAALSAPSVPTTFVAPGDPPPALDGEVVVKPNVSAAARDTGRFRTTSHSAALALIHRIHDSGRVALVQPYLPDIDRRGETAIVFVGGEISHVLRKRAILREDGVAPIFSDALGIAKVLREKDVVVAGTANAAELALARQIHSEVSERCGRPLFARIDLVPGLDGAPVLLELELIEPTLYFATSDGASERMAKAVLDS